MTKLLGRTTKGNKDLRISRWLKVVSNTSNWSIKGKKEKSKKEQEQKEPFHYNHQFSFLCKG